jgi:TolA-binding protein
MSKSTLTPIIAISTLTPIILALAAPVAAQDESVQRELIRRQQQSDEFSQQLRQSQELIKVPSGDLEARTRLESRQLDERQRLENLDASQLQRAGKDAPPEFRPQERERMTQERRPLVDAPPAQK